MNEQNKQPYEPYQPQPLSEPQQPVERTVYYAPQQPVQRQPIYVSQPAPDPTTAVMSVGAYIGMFILCAIPIVNIICWIVWLASPNTNKNKKNYLIACIVLWIIGILLSVIIWMIAGALGYDLSQLMKK